MAYRPEIDGLRALAVAPVVLYHAGVPGFSGGFVGIKKGEGHPPINDEVLVKVEGVSKKFCRSLKRLLWYGAQDAASEMLAHPLNGAGLQWRSHVCGLSRPSVLQNLGQEGNMSEEI